MLKGFYKIWTIKWDRRRLRIPESSDISDLHGIGIALSVQQTSGHSGIFYRDSARRISLFHFTGLLHVDDAAGRPEFVWAEPPLEREQIVQLSELCDFIKNSSPPFRASYRFPFSELARLETSAVAPYFLPQARFTPIAGCEGFTCATFLMFVCLQCGIRLLKSSSWQHDPKDAEFIRSFIETNIRPMRPDLVPVFERDVGSIRFRPDDVIVAGLVDELPVSFHPARQIGLQARKLTQDYYDRNGIAWSA